MYRKVKSRVIDYKYDAIKNTMTLLNQFSR